MRRAAQAEVYGRCALSDEDGLAPQPTPHEVRSASPSADSAKRERDPERR